MTDIRIIFSPHTADPLYLCGLVGVVMATQAAVMHTTWTAQYRLLSVIGHAMLQSHCAMMDGAGRASAWHG